MFDLERRVWDLEKRTKKVLKLKQERDNIYFKMHCLYKANTELFDRSLTDIRSKHDPTEAFIDGRVRNASNQYAILLYNNCKRSIEAETKAPFSKDLWIRSISSYRKLSAQGWIDLYKYMIENGEI